jgi:hypothetical protein
MDAATAGTVRLEDYRPPRFLIPEVELDIDLVAEDDARVRAQISVERNAAAGDPAAALAGPSAGGRPPHADHIHHGLPE